MSNDLNKCMFIGRLGREPELIHLKTGKTMCKFSIAVGEQYKDFSGEIVKTTEWINCAVFGNLVDVCTNYLDKGSLVYVAGKFKTNKYTTKDGVQKTSVDIVVNELQLLSFKEKSNKPAEPANDEFTDSEIPF